MYSHGRKTGCRISLDYAYRGMRVAFLENELLRVGVLLDKGADVFEFTYKPHDVDVMWQSPIPLRRPFVATSALPEGAFHDYFYGGWQEVLPSAGWSSVPYRGASQGLHGEASLLPFDARLVEDSPQRVSLLTRVQLYRSPLTLERTMTLEGGRAALILDERLTNDSTEPFAVMWGHHPALGEPFLDDSCVLQTPATSTRVLDFHANGLWEHGEQGFPLVRNRRTDALEDVRRVLPRETKSVDVLSFWGLSEGWYALTNRNRGFGFGMSWDPEVFPCLWMWQVYGGHDDYPWYGRTYNLALEPFTSWPPAGTAAAIENGTALVLGPGQTIETRVTAVAYDGDGVERITANGVVER